MSAGKRGIAFSMHQASHSGNNDPGKSFKFFMMNSPHSMT